MTFQEYSTIFFPFLVFVSVLIKLYRHQNNNAIIPTNWPVIGMLPAALAYVNEPHEYITNVLSHTGGAFLFKGPWLSNMDMLGTSNPLDIHHVMSKNFTNYPKGQKIRNILDILGDGFSNTDGELWEFQRRTFMSLFKLPSFHSLSKNTIWNKVENGLLPVLEHVSKQGSDVDLQDIFQRFAFDTICTLLFDYDPQSMSIEFPHVPCEKALSDIEEVAFHRCLTPQIFWKFQQLLRMGNEKKLSNAAKAIDQFIYKCLSRIQNVPATSIKTVIQEENFKLSTSLIRELNNKSGTSGDPNKFLRDNFLNLLVAGKNTTSSTLSCFFYLLGKNPRVEDKIQEELQTKLKEKMGRKLEDFITHEAHNLVYLHAALCEVLRLYPPVPFEHKTPIQPDTLPSGHQVDKNTSVALCYYTMGRMKSIWGEDCMEFKPERWISTAGEILHQPSYKFPAFNLGPRSCLGKDMSFSHMKIVAATVIHKYHVKVVEGQQMIPCDSVILKIKHGLKVRLTKRSEVKV